ncbi:MAG: hypothetical protein ABSH48_27725 [Verrucomicrobiota bacterium]
MKNAILQSWALAALLVLAGGCTKTQSQPPRVALTNTITLDSGYDADGANSKWHAKWTMVDQDNVGAFRDEPIYSNTIIKWKYTNNFSIMVTNRSEWVILTANTPDWRTDVCACLTNTTTGIIDSTNDAADASAQTITLQFTPHPSKTNEYAYRIFGSPIPKAEAETASRVDALLWPASYNDKMVEATLSWDGTTLEQSAAGR